MIIQSESHVNEQDKIDKNAKDKKGKVNVLFNSNTMGANDIKYEFRKTARHEIADGKSETVWDQLGRYLCIYGVKKPGPFDKEKRSVRIFSILGEQLHIIDKLTELSGFNFRPRPLNILSKKFSLSPSKLINYRFFLQKNVLFRIIKFNFYFLKISFQKVN